MSIVPRFDFFKDLFHANFSLKTKLNILDTYNTLSECNCENAPASISEILLFLRSRCFSDLNFSNVSLMIISTWL